MSSASEGTDWKVVFVVANQFAKIRHNLYKLIGYIQDSGDCNVTYCYCMNCIFVMFVATVLSHFADKQSTQLSNFVFTEFRAFLFPGPFYMSS